MTPERQPDVAPALGYRPALADFLERRVRVMAAYATTYDLHDACTFPLVQQAYHDRLVRLAAVLLGVDPHQLF